MNTDKNLEIPGGNQETKEVDDKQEKKEPRINRRNLFLLVLLSVILFSLTFIRLERYKFSIKAGDVAEEDIRAINQVEDLESTERLKEEAKKNAPIRYRISPSVQIGMKNQINKFFNKAKDLVENEELDYDKKIIDLDKTVDFDLPNRMSDEILNMSVDSLTSYQNTMLDLTSQIMGLGIREVDIEYEKNNLEYTFDTLELSDIQKEFGILMFKNIIKPNKMIDEIETERLQEEAVSKIDPVIVKENEIIVGQGEVIDSHELDLIRDSGLLKTDEEGLSIKTSLGAIILITLSMILIYLYIESFNKEILEDKRYLAVLLIVFLVLFVSEIIHGFSPYLLPVASGALLISVLIEPQLAIALNVIMSIYLGSLLRLDISIIYMMIVGGSLGVVTLKDQRERSNLIVNGIIIGITNVLVITAFGLLKQTSLKEILIRDLQVFLNGIIAVIITIGSLPLWENLFDILTPVRLVELSNPNQPLIKRMLMEAPGTYHHSLMVGNLGEAAAEAIGANALLTRVGASYHDIGKMERPYYFKENQFGMENPHDKLSPYQSAKIILRHPVAGEEMAREHKLPEEIVAFTTEHHGSTNVAYFYYEAKKENEDADIKDFTYTGKKPQSKETAIIMLADSVEAAVKSLKDPTREKIEEMTRKVMKGKIDAGQMDECDITNKDINLIEKAFVNTFMGIYHDRIAYPDEEDEDN